MKLPREKIKLKSLTICVPERKRRFFMKLPRGKIKLNSLTECSAGRKVEILYETFEREDEIKNFDQMLYRKEK